MPKLPAGKKPAELRCSFSMTRDLAREIDAAARADERSRSSWIRMALRRELERTRERAAS